MSISRFRYTPGQDSGDFFDGRLDTTVSATGTSDATAQNLDSYLALQGASEALLFITVTAKNTGGSDATTLNVKFRVASSESPPTATADTGWAWIRTDDLDVSTGTSTTRPYVAKIESIGTNFDAGEKLYVLSVPARGSYISARIWSDNACSITTEWMRK